MIQLITGPQLRRRCTYNGCARWGGYVEYPHIEYKYVNDRGQRRPEYDATHIVITAYYVVMAEDLHRNLAEVLRSMPGAVGVSFHPYNAKRNTRPLVRVNFDRAAAL